MKTNAFLACALVCVPASSTHANQLSSRNGLAKTEPLRDERPTLDVEDIASARRADLIRLAMLYSIDLERPTWIREALAICPAFSEHIFLRYHRTDEPNAQFIGIIPRRAGRLYIIRLGTYTQPTQPVAVRESTIATYNAVWSDEHAGKSLKTVSPNVDWNNLAVCYAEMAGERLSISSIGGLVPDEVPMIEHGEGITVSFEVVSKYQKNMRLSVAFDKRGCVTHVMRKPFPKE